MSNRKNYDYLVYSGDDYSLLVDVFDNDGNPVDISSANEIEYQIAPTVGDTPVVTKTLGAGTAVASPDSFSVDITTSDTSAIDGIYYHEAQVTTSQGLVYTVLAGNIWIYRSLI